MKRIVKSILAGLGVEIHRARSAPPGSGHRPILNMASFLEDVQARGFTPRGIIDVGANQGEWTQLARSVFPSAPTIMIEPQQEMVPLLTEMTQSPNIHFVQAGAGKQEGELIQTIWDDLAGSSFLPPASDELLKSGKQRKTPIVTLDGLLKNRFPDFKPDLVKLDIQGFELEALSGGESLFGRTELFILEASLFAFEQRTPLLRDVIEFMGKRGYELYDLPGANRRPLDGAMAQVDAAFVQASGRFRQSSRWQ